MKRLRPRVGKRLNSANYLKIDNDALVAVDYLPNKEILEVKRHPNSIYQFIDIPEKYWLKLKELIRSEPSRLSQFIDEIEKKFYYYPLIEQGLSSSASR